MKERVVTRFAPSPTGYLHVGGARTALFNYLFARKYDGKFRLRIEDTDKNRSSQEMTRKIFDGLLWMGLKWDDDVVYQGANANTHRQLAHNLLETNLVYRCFCSKEESEARKKAAEKNREEVRQSHICRYLAPDQVKERLNSQMPYSLRFKMIPGKTGWRDLVYGDIGFDHQEIEDFVILRSDGSPVYQLAVVADDHDMGITHIIRGADHIPNTPKQILLYQALGWKLPEFAHVPLILGSDKTRLSKRHGAASVDEYRKMGVLPEALFNYLALLGWSPTDDREFMNHDEIQGKFSLEGISKNNAIFDEKKLEWMNDQHISAKSPAELQDAVIQLWKMANFIASPATEEREYYLRIIELLKSRVHYLTDYVKYGRYYFLDPENYEAKGINKYLKDPEIWQWLIDVQDNLQELQKFESAHIEEVVRHTAENHEVSAAKLIHPIRLALTGMTVGPSLFDLMEVLGQEIVAKRLSQFVERRESLQPA